MEVRVRHGATLAERGTPVRRSSPGAPAPRRPVRPRIGRPITCHGWRFVQRTGTRGISGGAAERGLSARALRARFHGASPPPPGRSTARPLLGALPPRRALPSLVDAPWRLPQVAGAQPPPLRRHIVPHAAPPPKRLPGHPGRGLALAKPLVPPNSGGGAAPTTEKPHRKVRASGARRDTLTLAPHQARSQDPKPPGPAGAGGFQALRKAAFLPSMAPASAALNWPGSGGWRRSPPTWPCAPGSATFGGISPHMPRMPCTSADPCVRC